MLPKVLRNLLAYKSCFVFNGFKRGFFFVNCIKIYHPDVYFVVDALCLLFGVLRIRGFALLYVKRQNFIKLDTL